MLKLTRIASLNWHWRPVFALLAVCLGLFGTKASAEQGFHPKGVIELFTSQGCRSCPPADRAFERMVQQGDVVALAYHVDYWNYLGWADTLATSENTSRQYGYAKTFGRNGVYTPQAVLNGREHLKGTDTAELNARLDRMKRTGNGLVVPVALERDGEELKISVGRGVGKANVVVVYFRKNQVVEVLKGENMGQKLTYWNSVTDVQTVGMWDGNALELTLPAKLLNSEKADGCAVLLQASGDGGEPAEILGATVIVEKTS
ncbi:thioredoxin family protein [Peteryoungia desertarenae]|uniref:Thioredoxin family protein n=1 Tax=Peteryoungia desertarenae TaxID=1813451 RepID=A0ABX6QKM7_9HYPH|nr:thioredoxin family protein [Peteryoungia desertarenae]QLF68822.1 thioredoxin family protein [Peteryoungia desertarenae]